MRSTSKPAFSEHPVALGSFRSWMRVLRLSGGIDLAHLPKVLFVSFTTTLTSLLRLVEWIRYGRRLRRTRIDLDPIFIIGHWRSGTTHLHNLLTQDPRLGYVSTFQCMAPGFSLIGRGRIKRWLAKQASARYPTRLIDNIPLSLDAPQEEEFALSCLSHRSFLHVFTIPRKARVIFEKYVLFRELPRRARTQWIRNYLSIVKTATLHNPGKRLVLKNCANTGRIQTLIERFPNAMFIHIHRNPYDVYRSTRHLYTTVLQRSQIQAVDESAIRERVLEFYPRLMQRYLDDRLLIPPDHLIEMAYEDLEAQPMRELQRLYEHLQLPGFDEARPAFERYLDGIAGYRKNTYAKDPRQIADVNEQWTLAFERLGYEPLRTDEESH